MIPAGPGSVHDACGQIRVRVENDVGFDRHDLGADVEDVGVLGQPVRAARAGWAGRTDRARCSGRPLGSDGAGDPLRACEADVSLRSGRAGGADIALHALDALCPGGAVRADRARRSGRSLRAGGTDAAGGADVTRGADIALNPWQTLGAGRAGRTGGTLRASGAVIALRALDALRADGAGRSGQTGRSLRAGCTLQARGPRGAPRRRCRPECPAGLRLRSIRWLLAGRCCPWRRRCPCCPEVLALPVSLQRPSIRSHQSLPAYRWPRSGPGCPGGPGGADGGWRVADRAASLPAPPPSCRDRHRGATQTFRCPFDDKRSSYLGIFRTRQNL